MSDKQRHVKGVYGENHSNLMGPGSFILPGKKVRLSYNDTTWKDTVVETSNINVTENPLNGKIDVVIKLTLDKEEFNHINQAL